MRPFLRKVILVAVAGMSLLGCGSPVAKANPLACLTLYYYAFNSGPNYILNDKCVAYLDLTGSECETAAHVV